MGVEVLSSVMAQSNQSLAGKRIAVRIETNRAAIESALAERGASAVQWFEAKDDDELNQLVLQGRFDCIVYEKLELLFTAIWKSDVDWPLWKQRGVHVEFLDKPDSFDWLSVISTIEGNYRSWRCRERRRQIIAAILLSIAGLIALLTVLQAIPVAP